MPTKGIDDIARSLRVDVEATHATNTSTIVFGRRGGHPVALKIVARRGDEWNSGAILSGFGGRGMVRVIEEGPGFALMDRIEPGTSLVDLVTNGRDDEATPIIGGVMRAFSPRGAPSGTPTVEDWGRAFERYRAAGDEQVSAQLVTEAHAVYDELCASQTNRRLLHGDLQHSNILFDRTRGWIAIDPKGIIGEPEVEVGPFLRNPPEAVHLFTERSVVERRLRTVCDAAGLRYERALRWAFSLAVLSAIWEVEDAGILHGDTPALTLARALRPAIESAS